MERTLIGSSHLFVKLDIVDRNRHSSSKFRHLKWKKSLSNQKRQINILMTPNPYKGIILLIHLWSKLWTNVGNRRKKGVDVSIDLETWRLYFFWRRPLRELEQKRCSRPRRFFYSTSLMNWTKDQPSHSETPMKGPTFLMFLGSEEERCDVKDPKRKKIMLSG